DVLERQIVDGALLIVERPGDAVDLLHRQHVGALAFEFRKALVVRFPERLESRHELVERIGKPGLFSPHTASIPNGPSIMTSRTSASVSPTSARCPYRYWSWENG